MSHTKNKRSKTEIIPRVPPSTATKSPKENGTKSGEKTVRIAHDEQPRKVVIKNILPTELDSQYSVIKKIGDGGMGIVYLAQDNKLGRYVAIKRLNEASMAHQSIRDRFLQEAKTAAALTSPHIVHVYALDQDDEGPFIVMEYIPGPPERSPDSSPPAPFSLVELVQNDGPMDVVDAVEMMLKISKTIEYAHRSRVIHRDLKPSNILLDESSEPKIVDFGLARKYNPDDRKLTVPGERMLSLGYGAPEQESDAASSDERADIYGLGALMYFCMTGQNPRYFRESDLPKEVQHTISKALETDRENRWSTTTEFVNSLKKIQTPSEVEIPTVKTTWRCKWCDTVNPVGIQFCEDCGWDGITQCLECGASMHTGIQYCGECGADAREYENANRLLTRLQKRMSENDFEYVGKRAERSASFRPVGPNGRIIVEEILGLREKVEETLTRIKEIKEFIPMEMSSQNYERARQFIMEYRDLTGIQDFSLELNQLPELTARRDLQRASSALKKGDYSSAIRLSSGITNGNTSLANEAFDILNKVRRHQFMQIMRNAALMLLSILLIYAMSSAPVYKLIDDPRNDTFKMFYELEQVLHSSTFMKTPLELYANLWGVPKMYKDRDLQTALEEPAQSVPKDVKTAGRFSQLRSNYTKDLLTIETTYSRHLENWPRDYITMLEDLQQKMQMEGDYDGWNSVRDELYYFEIYEEINFDDSYSEEPEILTVAKAEFSDKIKAYKTEQNKTIYSLSSKYLEDLNSLLKKLTKDGKMDDATAIKQEIQRVENDETIMSAREAFIRDSEKSDTPVTE